MNILFLTDNFPPEGNAPASRTYEHAVEWIESGHEVTVITCAPNFPAGKLYPGYENRWYQTEVMSGIKVVRVKTYIAENAAFGKRILDYLSFGFMACIVGLFLKRPDVVISTSPQFFCACGAWLLAGLRRLPWIFELRDIWPASIVAVGAMQKSFAITLLEKLEIFLYHRADRIVAVTHSFKLDLISRGIDASKIDVIINGVDLQQYKPQREKDYRLLERYHLQGKFVVGYIGTHGLAHGLNYVLEAAEILRDITGICFVFAGGGAVRADIEKAVKEQQLDNVALIPQQNKGEMPALWSLCDVSLISLKDEPLFKQVIPSKIFESMGMGLPMIIACPEGEATEIIRNTKTGLIVPPEEPPKLAEAVRELYRNAALRKQFSENSQTAARQFDRKVMANKMMKSIRKIH